MNPFGLLWVFAALGFLLFTLTLFLKRRSGEDVALPETLWVQVDGQKVAYHQMGSGPDLVLIHGLGASSYCWRYLMPHLAMKYRVTAIDMVGFGHSIMNSALDYSLDGQGLRLHKTMIALGLKPKVVVGSSLGGLLALWLAQKHPDVYPQIVTLAPAALGASLQSNLHRTKSISWIAKTLVNSWTMPWFVFFVVGSLRTVSKQSLSSYLLPFKQANSISCFLLAVQAVHDQRIPGLFTGLSVPTLILWGRFDFLVSRKVVQRLKQVLPQSQLIELNSAHHPQEHIPEVVAEKIFAWLESSKV